MNRFDEELRTKLHQHSAEVPEGMWNSISAELVEDGSNRYILFYWLSGLLMIALLGMIAFKSIVPNEIVAIPEIEVIAEDSDLDENSSLLPLDSELNKEDGEVINNLIITKSSLTNNKEIDVSKSDFIENLKAIKKAKKQK